uniref:Uncharacterized protein n=1 Tax=Lepeophtheirus salmonis TaxID=72036 RepID=A0A0K2V380_LEPSM
MNMSIHTNSKCTIQRKV